MPVFAGVYPSALLARAHANVGIHSAGITRRRFFLGCEGQSEHSYGTLLQHLADSVPLHIHIELHDLRGGDPLAIVESAIARLVRQIRTRGSFVARALLLDDDQLGQNPARDAQIQPLVIEHRLLLVWQRPCHEALLLRHLPGCESLRPQNSLAANLHLSRYWQDYKKPMSANRLLEKIGLAELASAASVEPDLAILLTLLGLP